MNGIIQLHQLITCNDLLVQAAMRHLGAAAVILTRTEDASKIKTEGKNMATVLIALKLLWKRKLTNIILIVLFLIKFN